MVVSLYECDDLSLCSAVELASCGKCIEGGDEYILLECIEEFSLTEYHRGYIETVYTHDIVGEVSDDVIHHWDLVPSLIESRERLVEYRNGGDISATQIVSISSCEFLCC